MTGLLSLTSNGKHFLAELAPQWIAVGGGQSNPTAPIMAGVAIAYDHQQLPLVKKMVDVMIEQKREPVIAIFDNNVQVCLTIAPVPSEFMNGLPVLKELCKKFDGLDAFHITSVADIFREDPTFALFEKCYARDKVISVVFVAAGVADTHGGETIPFKIMPSKTLKSNMQHMI